MRSRYSAFVIENANWLLSSWHPRTRPPAVEFDNTQKWIGLKIIQTSGGRDSENTGRVEFVARFKTNGKAHRLHENSLFVREDGIWYYLNGDIKT